MKKILIGLFLMLILAFSIVGMTNHPSKPGTDIEQQQEANQLEDDQHIPWK